MLVYRAVPVCDEPAVPVCDEPAVPVCDVAAVPVAAAMAEEPAAGAAAEERSVLGLAELLLKNPTRLDRLARDASRQLWLVPSLLAVGLASFSLFALALVLTLASAPAEALPEPLAARWAADRTGAALALWLAYALGFTMTTGVCLPSFYFYGLLAGVRVSWPQVTAHIVKGQASTAVMLTGITPVYVAVALGGVIFGGPPQLLRAVLYVGLVLPFVAGLWGVRSIYVGFLGLSDTLPPRRRDQRERWLRRLTAACSACYTAVCPVMIFTLWVYFADHLTLAGF
jgi:hypothetical protein